MADIKDIATRIADSEAIGLLTARFMTLRAAQAVAVRIMPWLLIDPGRLQEYGFSPPPGATPNHIVALWEALLPGIELAMVAAADATTMAEADRRFRPGQTAPGYIREPFHVMLQVNAAALEPGDLQQTEAILRDHPGVFATIELRPPLHLQVAIGDTIHSGSLAGTVGGFIDDGGTIHGVTCSHVIAATRIDDVRGTQIGSAGAKSTPTALGAGSVCTPFAPPGVTAGPVNAGDFALISMSASVSASGLAMATALHQGDQVDVFAGTSRYPFQVRSLCIAMRLAFGGANYCFAPLVELYASSGTTKPGDSGAWGLRNQASEWAVMVAGADSISSFAFDARDVAQWIDGCGSVTRGSWSVY